MSAAARTSRFGASGGSRPSRGVGLKRVSVLSITFQPSIIVQTGFEHSPPSLLPGPCPGLPSNGEASLCYCFWEIVFVFILLIYIYRSLLTWRFVTIPVSSLRESTYAFSRSYHAVASAQCLCLCSLLEPINPHLFAPVIYIQLPLRLPAPCRPFLRPRRPAS